MYFLQQKIEKQINIKSKFQYVADMNVLLGSYSHYLHAGTIFKYIL